MDGRDLGGGYCGNGFVAAKVEDYCQGRVAESATAKVRKFEGGRNLGDGGTRLRKQRVFVRVGERETKDARAGDAGTRMSFNVY